MIPPIRLVLDTNVVIDWLVFDDPYLAPLRRRVRAGEIHVLSNALATAELARVLGYPELKLDLARRAGVLAQYQAQATVVSMPAGFSATDLRLPAGFPRCRDRDDDAFLALAFHARAAGLVTRDRALLELEKRARKFEVAILGVPQMMGIVSA